MIPGVLLLLAPRLNAQVNPDWISHAHFDYEAGRGLIPRTLAPRHRLAQQELDLRIHAAQIIRRPFFENV